MLFIQLSSYIALISEVHGCIVKLRIYFNKRSQKLIEFIYVIRKNENTYINIYYLLYIIIDVVVTLLGDIRSYIYAWILVAISSRYRFIFHFFFM